MRTSSPESSGELKAAWAKQVKAMVFRELGSPTYVSRIEMFGKE